MQGENGSPNDPELAAMGFGRKLCIVTGRETVYVMYSGRSLTLVDMEHMCCKIYLLLSRTKGTRCFSQPRTNLPFCYPCRHNGKPVKDQNSSHPDDYENLKSCMITIYDSFFDGIASGDILDKTQVAHNLMLNHEAKDACTRAA